MNRVRKAVIATLAAVIIMGSTVAVAGERNAGKAMPGVHVGGVPVGGTMPAEMTSLLTVTAGSLQKRPLLFEAGSRRMELSPDDLGLHMDVAATVERAMSAGRGSPARWAAHALLSREVDVGWVVRIDEDGLTGSLQKIAAELESQASDGSVSLEGTQVVVTPPAEGLQVLRAPLRRMVIDAVAHPTLSGRLRLPVTVTPPSIGADDVAAAEEAARSLLSSDRWFISQARTFSMPPAEIAKSMKVSSDDGTSLSVSFDEALLSTSLQAAAPWAVSPPKDASFVIEGQKVRVSPHVEGTAFDAAAAANALLSGLGEKAAPIELATIVQPPSFTTAEAEGLKITEQVAVFSTAFDPRNAPRVVNIDLMASAIDGTILRPGEVFSLNDTTGPRTAANGYQTASIIVNGELVPGIGGGVCQVATTLFNAAFLAGYEVVDRRNHSLYISSYPIGRDATVNYGYQDLKFRNDSDAGILVKTRVTKTHLHVHVYSAPTGRTVTTTTSERRNFKDPDTRYIDDPSLPEGQEVVVEKGAQGFDITVTRKVMSGGEMLHSDSFVSKYRPWRRVVRRGTGPPAVSPAPSPSQ